MNPRTLEPGDVVQIAPEANPVFGGCFLVIDEPKPWGAVGYIEVPGHGRAFFRCTFNDMEYIGPATWVRDDETDSPESEEDAGTAARDRT